MSNASVAPDTMPWFLTDADVRAVFDWHSAIDALRQAYSAPANAAMFPPRGMARGEGVWLRTLSGLNPGGGLMGAKLIAASICDRRASYLIPLAVVSKLHQSHLPQEVPTAVRNATETPRRSCVVPPIPKRCSVPSPPRSRFRPQPIALPPTGFTHPAPSD
jgi:hypothetical protein